MGTPTPELDVDDAIVLILGAHPESKLRGITRLEKLLFLLEKETNVGSRMTEDPEFEAYNFGPFSKKVYQAIDTLVAAGLVSDSARLSSTVDDSREEIEYIGGGSALTPYSTRDFSLTPLGREYFRALGREYPEWVLADAASTRDRFEAWPLRQLVTYVYRQYPDYAENSLIRQEILGD